ncbi:hypothetical protein [Tahibacter amnicola]|uniref:Uncharacterized protein n=1 Tax=Tahibacter amnicola TaxID=2976241 RepID=A0ABY6BKN7_9GAMM|nr:hypothetical protein [Tahibacter amnicola]UXI70583.1 hypothetical protein N4264_13355 [Tahibacter amnicola]
MVSFRSGPVSPGTASRGGAAPSLSAPDHPWPGQLRSPTRTDGFAQEKVTMLQTPDRRSPLSLSLLATAILLGLAGTARAEAPAVGGTLRFVTTSVAPGDPVKGRIYDAGYWGVPGSRTAYVLFSTTPLDESGVAPLKPRCVRWQDQSGADVIIQGHGSYGGNSDPSLYASFEYTAPQMPPGYVRAQIASDEQCRFNLTQYDTLQVTTADARPVREPGPAGWAPGKSISRPKPGSYVIFKNFQRVESQTPPGYEIVEAGLSRMEVEAPEDEAAGRKLCPDLQPDLAGRVAWRMTKMTAYGYWGPADMEKVAPKDATVRQFRFCASPKSISPLANVGHRTFLSATGGTMYVGSPEYDLELAKVAVSYNGAKLPAALGSFPQVGDEFIDNQGNRKQVVTCVGNGPVPCVVEFDFDRGTNYNRGPGHHQVMTNVAFNAPFYSLLPSAEGSHASPDSYRVPLALKTDIGRAGEVMVEQDSSARPTADWVPLQWTGVWHTEAFAPHEAAVTPAWPGSAELRMRYVEYGQYNVTEDWVWRNNGLVTRISQWWPRQKRCWKQATYTCADGGLPPDNDAQAIETFVPNTNPDQADLHVRTFAVDNEGWTIDLRQAIDTRQRYSGFLEFKIGDREFLLRDRAGRPIYVHHGRVHIPWNATAPVDLPPGTHHVSVRPFFTEAPLDATSPRPQVLKNENRAGLWSNVMPLIVR